MNVHIKRVYDRLPPRIQDIGLTAYSLVLHHQRYGGEFRALQRLLEQTERYTSDESEAYQSQHLQQLVRHAYETVPFYRLRFNEHGIDPAGIKTPADLKRLPLLTKDDIRRNFVSLTSDAYPQHKISIGHTSGTTGTPLEIAYNRSLIHMTYAALDRQYRWAGIRLALGGDRTAILRGNVIVPIEQNAPPFWRTNYLHNQLFLSSFHLSPQNLGFYLGKLKKFRPKALDGYPSTLYVLARYLKSQGEVLPLQAVLSSSETLYDFQRETIEESFGCRVFDYYGAAERVVFATECDRHAGHHLNPEFGISEILRENGQPAGVGEEGVLVGTSLHNYAMPLIRYVTNDRTAVQSQRCSCGRSMPLMEDVATKAEDIITLRDGRLVSPSVLTHPFKPMHTVEMSQIVQEDYDRVRILVVPAKGYADADTEHLLREFRARLGADTRVEVELVEELPRSASGKFKWVVSKVRLGI